MAASTARRWFDHARRDLNTAWSAARGPRAERGNAAYFLHEAAEKLLKGLLVLREIRPAKTHDLEALARKLPDDLSAKQELIDLRDLTPYGVAFRYSDQPETMAQPSLEEIDRWIERLEDLLARAEGLLAEPAAGGE